MLGVASAGVVVRCGGGGKPASVICTRAAIHRRVVEHMDGARSVGGRVVVGDTVARVLLLLLSLYFVLYRRR